MLCLGPSPFHTAAQRVTAPKQQQQHVTAPKPQQPPPPVAAVPFRQTMTNKPKKKTLASFFDPPPQQPSTAAPITCSNEGRFYASERSSLEIANMQRMNRRRDASIEKAVEDTAELNEVDASNICRSNNKPRIPNTFGTSDMVARYDAMQHVDDVKQQNTTKRIDPRKEPVKTDLAETNHMSVQSDTKCPQTRTVMQTLFDDSQPAVIEFNVNPSDEVVTVPQRADIDNAALHKFEVDAARKPSDFKQAFVQDMSIDTSEMNKKVHADVPHKSVEAVPQRSSIDTAVETVVSESAAPLPSERTQMVASLSGEDSAEAAVIISERHDSTPLSVTAQSVSRTDTAVIASVNVDNGLQQRPRDEVVAVIEADTAQLAQLVDAPPAQTTPHAVRDTELTIDTAAPNTLVVEEPVDTRKAVTAAVHTSDDTAVESVLTKDEPSSVPLVATTEVRPIDTARVADLHVEVPAAKPVFGVVESQDTSVRETLRGGAEPVLQGLQHEQLVDKAVESKTFIDAPPSTGALTDSLKSIIHGLAQKM